MLKNEALAVVLTLALCASVVTVQAARRAPGHPRQALRLPAVPRAPIALNIGDQVTIGGQPFTVSATLIPGGSTPPPPPPPPPAPMLTGYSTNPVTAGAAFLLNGSGFTDPLASATWNGTNLPLTLVSPTSLRAVAPPIAVTATAPVLLLTSGVTLTGPLLTVSAGAGPAPDMTIFGYRDGQRNPAIAFFPGTTVIIQGKGFGMTRGTVKVNNALVPPVRWTEAELEIVAPSPATGARTGPVALEIRRPDGSFYATQGFVLIAPPAKALDR